MALTYTAEQLAIYQALPLDVKIGLTQQRIREWYNHFGGSVYVSFSGGKDSTVLLHLVRSMYPEVKAVFCNTGLEYPEIQDFVRGNPKYDPSAPKMDGDWENWNPKKIWVPSEKGLGMGKVFDMVNEIYGKNFYRYE